MSENQILEARVRFLRQALRSCLNANDTEEDLHEHVWGCLEYDQFYDETHGGKIKVPVDSKGNPA